MTADDRLRGVRGFLIDIDGTLLADDQALPGAAAVIDRLRAAGYPFRLATNTTRRSRAAVADVMNQAGFRVDPGEILTPAALARRRIIESGRPRAALFIPGEARSDLPDIVPDEQTPDWVVLGDLGPEFTYERMNVAFRCLRQGAAFLALHRNRYWHAGARGWVLDAGAYVAALEYATGASAELVGKPSVEFFRLALADLGLTAGQVLVVGDDPDTDAAGGAAAGCRTALVCTGKFRGDRRDLGGLHPELILDSISELI